MVVGQAHHAEVLGQRIEHPRVGAEGEYLRGGLATFRHRAFQVANGDVRLFEVWGEGGEGILACGDDFSRNFIEQDVAYEDHGNIVRGPRCRGGEQ